MKNILKNLSIVAAIVFFVTSIVVAQEVPAKLKDVATTKLAAIGSAAEIVSAVKGQNAKGLSVEKHKEIDKKWLATSGVDDFMKGQMSSAAATFLKGLKKQFPYLDEIFVMDEKGANVAITSKTTNYWRGDKDKFTKSYNGGKGAVYYGKMQFDDSTQSYLIQISVPVMDDGKAIGVIVFGVDTEKFKAAK